MIVWWMLSISKLSIICGFVILMSAQARMQQPVQILDGRDATQGAKADAKSTATDTTPVTLMQIFKEISFMEQNPVSRAVTNAGTFAVQATQVTSPWVISFTAPQHIIIDSGSISNTTFAVTQSGTWTVQPGNTANTTAWKVDGSAVTQPVSGTVTATAPSVTTATLANVSSSATSVTCQASNASRKGWKLVNDSTQTIYIKFGATASATSYTIILPGGTTPYFAQYEMSESTVYSGIIDCIWASANGSARVTEY